MGRNKQLPLTPHEKMAATQKAQHLVRKAILEDLVVDNLYTADGEDYRTLTREMKQFVICVLAAGGTVTLAAEKLGIGKGVINMARQIDEDFRKEYDMARRAGSGALVDRIREIARDGTLSDARAKLEFDALKWTASRYDRDQWGEHTKVDHNVTVQPVAMPDWSFGQIIDVKPTEGDPDNAE